MALNQDTKKQIIVKMSGGDKNTGSAETQIGLLTSKIHALNDHLRTHIHDFSSKRGLLKNVGQRRKLLKYLSQRDPKNYEDVLAKLQLRK